jgi:hypothetical protein
MNDTDAMATLLNELYASFASGDPTVWIDSLAPDVVLIGTDPAEWWQGKDAVTDVVKAQLGEMSSAGMRLVGGANPHIGVLDGSAWIADQPVMHLHDGTEVPLRLTLVASFQGGTAKVQHMHLSVGAANEEMLQQELTI